MRSCNIRDINSEMEAILKFYTKFEDILESPELEGYKSIGVPYENLLSSQRTQKIEQTVHEQGMDYILSPQFVFGRIKDRYHVINIGAPVVVCVSKFVDEINILSDEYGESLKIYAPTEDEMKHQVILKHKNAELPLQLGIIIGSIETKIESPITLLESRFVNRIIAKKLGTSDVPAEYNIVDELRALLVDDDKTDDENEDMLHRVLIFYRRAIFGAADAAGERPKIWIKIPTRDTKVVAVFNMINRAIFGMDAEIVSRKSRGNFLRNSIDGRLAVKERFVKEYGPIGILIVQASEENTEVLYAVRRTPTIFIMSRGPDALGVFGDITQLDVSSTRNYTVPRVHTAAKFNVAEIYNFIDHLRDLSD